MSRHAPPMSRRRAGGLLTAVASAATAVFVAGGAVALRPDSTDSAVPGSATSSLAIPSSSSDIAPGAPTQAQAQTLLNRMARAVLDRDRSAFAAGLDLSTGAESFRRAQLAAFDNLMKVPLATWAYTIQTPLTGGGVIKTAAARYSAPTLLARVQLGYAIRDVDPAPTQRDLWLSFVRRGDDVRLAGDTDVDEAGGTTWRGPWDYGPLISYRGTSSLVLAHPANQRRMADLAALVDRAVPVVTGVWGQNWARQVLVIVPNTQEEMGNIVGGNLDLDSIAAVAIADVVEGGAAYGQRVVLNPANLDKYGTTGARIVVQHEVTHIATRATTGGVTPVWLIEGFADYVGNLGSGQSTAVAARELRDEIKKGKIPTKLPEPEDFDARNGHAPQAYEQAWLACRLITELRGRDGPLGEKGLVAFYRQVGAATIETQFEQALYATTGLTHGEFVQRWQQYLRTELA